MKSVLITFDQAYYRAYHCYTRPAQLPGLHLLGAGSRARFQDR